MTNRFTQTTTEAALIARKVCAVDTSGAVITASEKHDGSVFTFIVCGRRARRFSATQSGKIVAALNANGFNAMPLHNGAAVKVDLPWAPAA